jgi:AcrR family transcriptional regulator
MVVDAGLLLRVFGEPAAGDDRILDGALAAFLDFGVKRASMGEVARRAKISPATLYRKFPSKNAVVEAVGLREARRLVAAVDETVDKAADGEEQVVQCFTAFARELNNNQLLLRLLDTEPEAVLPHLTIEGGPLLTVGRGYLAAFIRRLQQERKLPDFDADQVGEICARLALSFALTRGGVVDLEDPIAAQAFARDHITALMRTRQS